MKNPLFCWKQDAGRILSTRLKQLMLIAGLLVFTSIVYAQVRPDINSFSNADQTTLANAMMQYIDKDVIESHCRYNTVSSTAPPHIHSDFDFLPFHRMYIQGMEDYLTSLIPSNPVYATFVPLPSWNPATCTPTPFQTCGNSGVDPDCSSASCTNGNGTCSGTSTTWCPNVSLPSDLQLANICNWNMNPTNPPTAAGTCGTCTNCCGSGLSRKIESPYHDNVHVFMGNLNTATTTDDAVMGNFRSPSMPIFWLWHAYVDDIWKTWEENCSQSTTLPVDLWMADNRKLITSDRDRGEEPDIDNGPMWTSEDIWLRKNADGLTNQVSEEPEWESGQPFFVYVRVRNRGFDPSLGTEKVQLSWAKANTGLNWPGNWNNTTFVGSVVMGKEIGLLTITTPIDAGDQQILEFVWNNPPKPDDYALINSDQWHFCLLARVDASNDPMAVTETGDVNYNTKQNNNIVWRNVRIQNVTPGIIAGGGDCNEDVMQAMGSAVAVANPYKQKETFDITFEVPIEELGHCPEEKCTIEHQMDSEPHDVFGFPGNFPPDEIVHTYEPPITKEGIVMVALDNQLYEKWVKGGKKGTGFTEILSPEMSTKGTTENRINVNSPIVVSDRKMFQITAETATFNNITLNAGELHTTTMMVLYPTNPISDKQEFKYDIIQKESATGKVIGGVRYDINKPKCTEKAAEAGKERTINRGCSTLLDASPDLKCANYYWLDQNGNLISRNASITVSPGKTTTYTLKTVSAEGCFSEDKVTVNVSNQFCLKEREIIEISPNPARDKVTIKYRIENTSSAQLRIVKNDNSFESTYKLDLKSNEIILDIAKFPSGNYTVVLIANEVNSDSKSLMILK